MPRKSKKLSESRSGTEETDWYQSPEGRRQTQREFERALKSGKLIRSPGSLIARTNPAAVFVGEPLPAPPPAASPEPAPGSGIGSGANRCRV